MHSDAFKQSALHLLGLWAIAIAQPMLDLLGANPEFFVAHRAGAADVLVLTLAIAAVPPGLLVLILRLAALAGRRASAVAFYASAGALACVLAMQVVIRAGATRWFVAVPLAVAAAALVMWAHRRWAPARTFFTALSLTALVAPTLFWSRAEIRGFIFSRGPATETSITTPRRATPTPVVLVVFDELPLLSLLDAGRNIDPDLYPNFSSLARDGVWYRNATTVHAFTRWAVPSIVSGRYPRDTALPSALDHPDTLFTLLGTTHRLEVSEAVTSLCPERLCPPDGHVPFEGRLAAMARDLRVVFLHMVLTDDLTAGLPDPTETWGNFDAGGTPRDTQDADDAEVEQVDTAVRQQWRQHWREGMTALRVPPIRAFIDGISRHDPQPTLYFIHTLVSHHPHILLPGGRLNKVVVRLPEERPLDESWALAQEYQRHLLQVGYIDYLIGELVTHLKNEGLYDTAMIVITADHGASYTPGTSLRSYQPRNAAEIMRVPLIVKFPARLQVPPRVSDENAEAVDVLPTIADALDIVVPWPVDGTSLLDPARRERGSKAMFTTGRRHNVDRTGPDLEPALRRKLELFGDGASNPHRAPRVPPFNALLGRPLAALKVEDGGEAVEIAHAWEFENVDPEASEMACDVVGTFASPRPDTVVAVAVNGVVEAVTRTWKSNPRGWVATPRFDVWRPGRNAIEVFVVERREDGPLLRRAPQGQVRPEGLNLISASAAEQWGVDQRGFHGVERRPDGQQFRWTTGRARLSNVLAHREPRALQVDVLQVPGGTPKELKIEANDCLLFQGLVRGGWSVALPLERCDVSAGLTIRFTTAAAPGKKDRRRLGVALSQVVLH
jgi:arylsulfatase A-like enzyme